MQKRSGVNTSDFSSPRTLVEIVIAPSERARTIALLQGKPPVDIETVFSSNQVSGLLPKLIEFLGAPYGKFPIDETISKELCAWTRAKIGQIINDIEMDATNNGQIPNYQEISKNYQNFIRGLSMAEFSDSTSDNKVAYIVISNAIPF